MFQKEPKRINSPSVPPAEPHNSPAKQRLIFPGQTKVVKVDTHLCLAPNVIVSGEQSLEQADCPATSHLSAKTPKFKLKFKFKFKLTATSHLSAKIKTLRSQSSYVSHNASSHLISLNTRTLVVGSVKSDLLKTGLVLTIFLLSKVEK